MKFLIIFVLVAVTASVNGGPRPVPTTTKPTTVGESTNESGIATDYDYDYDAENGNGSEDTGESDDATPEESELEGEETEVAEESVTEEIEPSSVTETFELTNERDGDAEEHEEKTEESIEVVTKEPSTPEQPKTEAKSANKSTQKSANRLSKQELQDYWRAYDNCIPKMRSDLGAGLETKLRNGEYKDLGYYDKCTILCFLYDNWIVENYRLNQTKLERLLDGSGSNLQSTMSQCVKPLPVDCLIAYDIYSCFAEKGATIFFKTYTR